MAVEALEECVPCLTEGYKGQYKRSDEGRVKGSSDFALHAGPASMVSGSAEPSVAPKLGQDSKRAQTGLLADACIEISAR